jgi:hypothetical protein
MEFLQPDAPPRPGPVRGQMSRQSWIRTPDGGCFAIVTGGYPATTCRRVPWNQSDHAPDWLPVITIRYWSGRP